MKQLKNFLIKREQSRAGSGFAECEKSRRIAKTLLTLVALLAVTTGAWAQGPWTSGDCTVTLSGGTLTVSGTGEMYGDYDDVDEKAPWVSSASSITSLVIEDGVTYIGDYAFYNLSALTSVTFGKDVARIDDHAFYKCTSLTEITFPASVKEIGPNILANCSNLTEVTFLATDLESMENAPFYKCGNLKTINIYAETPCGIGPTTFSEIANLEHIYVPAGSVNAYQNALNWTNVASYIAAMPAQGTPVTFTRGTGDKANEWTMDGGMPAGNVTVSVLYYDLATLATDAVTAATEAAANTDAELVTVADNAATGGTLMYYVTTDANFTQAQAIALAETAWSEDVPTADGFNFDTATDVYVWYYLKGDAEHSDTDPVCVAVTVLPEPTYNVEFAKGTNPEAPADPIWTATPNTGVKKGQTVTVTYTGTRKVIGVKAEKKAAAPATATIAGVELNVESGQTWETIVANNSDKIYLDGDNYVRLTANNTYLFYNGSPAYKTTGYSTTGTYQWLKVLDIDGAKIYYQEGETWDTAISAGRLLNENWFIDSNLVKCVGHGTLYVDSAVSPSAVINANSEYEFY